MVMHYINAIIIIIITILLFYYILLGLQNTRFSQNKVTAY